jgi:hypothetical protein
MFLAIVTDTYAFVRSESLTKDSCTNSNIKHNLEQLISILGYERKNGGEDNDPDSDKYTYKEIIEFLQK